MRSGTAPVDGQSHIQNSENNVNNRSRQLQSMLNGGNQLRAFISKPRSQQMQSDSVVNQIFQANRPKQLNINPRSGTSSKKGQTHLNFEQIVNKKKKKDAKQDLDDQTESNVQNSKKIKQKDQNSQQTDERKIQKLETEKQKSQQLTEKTKKKQNLSQPETELKIQRFKQTIQQQPEPEIKVKITAKERKKQQLLAQKEREKEAFEKNFQSSSLQISKMRLTVQKSFISKPNAIIVYHQERLVKLDITTNSMFQLGAVPTIVPDPLDYKMLITPQELSDFYNFCTLRTFKNVGRNLEIEVEPKQLFEQEQQNVDPTQHTIQERKIREVVDESLKEKYLKESTAEISKNPIVFPSRNVKETTIFFNSRFDSGNLREVEKLHEFEYNLYVNFDFQSSTHSQWYFFAVRNIGKGNSYKFNIMNLQKDESCYQTGMKPFVYSINENKKKGTHLWKRAGENVCYYKNKLSKKVRESAPDYEFDEHNIACYEFEDEESQTVYLNSLSFCYEFEFENDTTYFAYFQPYSLSDLKDYLFKLQKSYEEDYLQSIYRKEILCKTIADNPVYIITITENIQDEEIHMDSLVQTEIKESQTLCSESYLIRKKAKKQPEADVTPVQKTHQSKASQVKGDSNQTSGMGQVGGSIQGSHSRAQESGISELTALLCASNEGQILSGFQMAARNNEKFDFQANHQKQTIFLTARQHPGESNSSYMIQGCIDFLLQKNNKEAKLLRETFIFKIIPMLNPDGVVHGHYRCNMVGVDLNRRWPNPSKLLHPEIFYTKKIMRVCHQDNQIVLFCDFHGHTRKRNVFMYGCVSTQNEINQHKNNNLIRLVPFLLDQKNLFFSFADCRFANEREKESTGRMVMFKEFGILNSYTIEATFYAAMNNKVKNRKVNVEDDQQIKDEDLFQVGHDFCETLLSIINSKIMKKKFLLETAVPLGSLGTPGQGGNPVTSFMINQQNEEKQSKPSEKNSVSYNQNNNVKSVIRSFINGSNLATSNILMPNNIHSHATPSQFLQNLQKDANQQQNQQKNNQNQQQDDFANIHSKSEKKQIKKIDVLSSNSQIAFSAQKSGVSNNLVENYNFQSQINLQNQGSKQENLKVNQSKNFNQQSNLIGQSKNFIIKQAIQDYQANYQGRVINPNSYELSAGINYQGYQLDSERRTRRQVIENFYNEELNGHRAEAFYKNDKIDYRTFYSAQIQDQFSKLLPQEAQILMQQIQKSQTERNKQLVNSKINQGFIQVSPELRQNMALRSTSLGEAHQNKHYSAKQSQVPLNMNIQIIKNENVFQNFGNNNNENCLDEVIESADYMRRTTTNHEQRKLESQINKIKPNEKAESASAVGDHLIEASQEFSKKVKKEKILQDKRLTFGHSLNIQNLIVDRYDEQRVHSQLQVLNNDFEEEINNITNQSEDQAIQMPPQKCSKHGLTPNPKIKNSVDHERDSIEGDFKQQQFVIKKNSQIVNKYARINSIFGREDSPKQSSIQLKQQPSHSPQITYLSNKPHYSKQQYKQRIQFQNSSFTEDRNSATVLSAITPQSYPIDQYLQPPDSEVPQLSSVLPEIKPGSRLLKSYQINKNHQPHRNIQNFIPTSIGPMLKDSISQNISPQNSPNQSKQKSFLSKPPSSSLIKQPSIQGI